MFSTMCIIVKYFNMWLNRVILQLTLRKFREYCNVSKLLLNLQPLPEYYSRKNFVFSATACILWRISEKYSIYWTEIPACRYLEYHGIKLFLVPIMFIAYILGTTKLSISGYFSNLLHYFAAACYKTASVLSDTKNSPLLLNLAEYMLKLRFINKISWASICTTGRNMLKNKTLLLVLVKST